MKPIRVLIADDHALFREGVNAILKSVPDIELVGEAGTGQEALTLASDLTPDVILMDIQMPDLNGVEATQRILETHPHVGIIIVTMLEDDDSLFSATESPPLTTSTTRPSTGEPFSKAWVTASHTLILSALSLERTMRPSLSSLASR